MPANPGLTSGLPRVGEGLSGRGDSRRVFLLTLPGAASGRHFRADAFGTAPGEKNLAAHRRSNVLSRSRGIMVITKAWSPRSRRAQRALSFKGPPFDRRLAQSARASPAVARFGRHLKPANPGLTSGQRNGPNRGRAEAVVSIGYPVGGRSIRSPAQSYAGRIRSATPTMPIPAVGGSFRNLRPTQTLAA
jgi:hypothetical protein